MTKRYHTSVEFSSLKRRNVHVSFEGGDITSDGGALLLREADKRLGLTEAASRALHDPRRRGACQHSQLSMLRQRIFGLALGYEDINDHIKMRHDGALKTAVGEIDSLASSSTLCRFEQRADARSAFNIHKLYIDQFVSSHKCAPEELVLDFDATHDLVYGEQIGRRFNGFYDGYCFLPLYVFCGKQLLVSYLRPSNLGASHHAAAVLKLLVRELRKHWPQVKIIIRADAGFCNPLLLNWCDRNKVDYVIGMIKNSALTEKAGYLILLSGILYRTTNKPQRHFGEFQYQARTWNQKRRMVVKTEYSEKGENTRYVVTSIKGKPRFIYETLYCARGNMENCIKEQKSLFSDRTSCHQWWPNQFRLLLSGLAYVLMEAIRRIALQNTEFETSQFDTIRLKLLKIGGIVLINTRSIRLLLPTHFPYQAIFIKAAKVFSTA